MRDDTYAPAPMVAAEMATTPTPATYKELNCDAFKNVFALDAKLYLFEW